MNVELSQEPTTGLVRTARSGALWQGLAFLIGKGLVALTTIVLARLLAPHEFGLVAMATLFITFADTIGDSGVAQALIYLDRTRETIRAATALALASGAALMLGLMAVAPWIADLYGEPRVEPLTQLMAVALLVNAAAAVPEALLRADLQFSRWSLAVSVKATTIGVVSICLALLGMGALSLVLGTLAGSLVYLCLLLLLLTSKPDLRFWRARRAGLRAVVRYGIPVAAAMLLSRLIFDLDYVVVASIGARELGLYTLAFKLPELAIIQIFFVISSVTYPLYTRANSDLARLRRGYLLSMKIQSLYGVTAGVGLAVTASLVVPVVLGEKWNAAIPALVVLSLYAAIRSLSAGANDVYKALGRPALSVWISLVRLVLLVPALIYGARWGILGVAVAQALMATVFAVLMQAVALRVLGLSWPKLLEALFPGILTAAGTGATAWLVSSYCPGPDGLVLLAAVVAAALAGAAVMILTARDAVAAVAPKLLRGGPRD
jgi:lipopolysaccharide exporter